MTVAKIRSVASGVVGLGALLLFASCHPVANIYDTCSSGEECPLGTACTLASTSISQFFVGTFCTVGCSVDTDCPPDGTPFAPLCEFGQCYAGCPGNVACPFGETCAADNSTNPPFLFCVP
jgi:hypothetical protein